MRRVRLLYHLSKIYKKIHPRKSILRFLNKAIWLPTDQLDRIYDAMYFREGIEYGGLY